MTDQEASDLAFLTIAAKMAGEEPPAWPANGVVSRAAIADGLNRYFREVATRLDRIADEGASMEEQEERRRVFDEAAADVAGAVARLFGDHE